MRCVPCTDTCPAGHYITGECDGSGTNDTKSCLPCRSSCEEGYRLTGECGDNAVNTGGDDFGCMACSMCGVGEFVAEGCAGGSFNDTVVCGTCKVTNASACGTGYYLAWCDGSSTEDTSVCMEMPTTTSTPEATTSAPTATSATSAHQTTTPLPQTTIEYQATTPASTTPTPSKPIQETSIAHKTTMPLPHTTTKAQAPSTTPSPTTPGYQISMLVRMDGSKADFKAKHQSSFEAAILAATPNAVGVKITSVLETTLRRRMLLATKIEIDFQVDHFFSSLRMSST